MPMKNKWESVILKTVIEIDGTQYIVKQQDYTESMNEMAMKSETFISSKAMREMILEDIKIGEA